MATSTPTRHEPSRNGAHPPRRPMAGAAADAASVTSRNRTRILLGVLIALGSAFAAAVLYSDAGERSAVLVVARPIAAGQTIESSDLREATVAVDDGIQVVSAAQRNEIVGRTASVPLSEGALVVAGQVGDEPLSDPADAVFGAVLAEGSFPSGLRAGDPVLLYELPAGTEASSDPSPVSATVLSVDAGGSTGTVSISFGIHPGDAGAMAIAAGQDRLIVVLAPR